MMARHGLRSFVRCFVVAIAAWSAGLLGTPAGACTTAVISGRATADGRPLLWKNRDAPHQSNQVVYLTDGKYRCLAVVNAGQRSSIWMGVNEVGLCIENSVIKDMPGGSKVGPGNGEFMKLVLQTCSTVDEVEELLKRTNETGRRTQGNFGVIDGQGGAVLFEAGHRTFAKFDANDPDVAPEGFIVRSNFSMTGTGAQRLADEEGLTGVYSAERYCRADTLLGQAVRNGRPDHRFVLRHCCRDMADSDGCAFGSTVNGSHDPLPPLVDTTATLSRKTTVSAAVFHGVKSGEDPSLTTMWVLLGDPAFTVAVPCWVEACGVADELHGGDESPLCQLTIEIRKANYDDEAKLLRSNHLPAIWSRNWKLEDRLFAATQRTLERWRAAKPNSEEMLGVHREAARSAYIAIQKIHAMTVLPSKTPMAELTPTQ